MIVVKLEFDRLESDWNNAGRPTFVTDERNIVLITSLPSWRFMTIGSIDQEQLQSIRDSLQFGDAPLKPLPLSIKSIDGEDVQLIDALLPGNARNTDFLAIRSIVPSTPWQMYSLAPIRPQIPSAIRESRLFTFIILSAIATVAGLLYVAGRKSRHASPMHSVHRWNWKNAWKSAPAISVWHATDCKLRSATTVAPKQCCKGCSRTSCTPIAWPSWGK